MANFFKPSKPTVQRYFDLSITGLDGRCIGIGKTDNRTWFVPGTMPGDRIKAERTEVSKNTGFAKVQKFYEKSPERLSPACNHEKCGGCSCMFIPADLQIQAKKMGIQQIFHKNAGFDLPEPDHIVEGSKLNYRRTCRLSTYYNRNSKCLEIGFRQAGSHRIEEISSCPVLKNSLSKIIDILRRTLNQLSIREFIGHVELTEAENGIYITIQHNRDFSPEDMDLMQNQLCDNSIFLCLLDKSHKLRMLNKNFQPPFYTIQDIKLQFSPESFIQINSDVNEKIVSAVLEYARIQPEDQILDLFCGMGNLTLPLARKARKVTGVEVVAEMVDQAQNNARANNIENAVFVRQDLSEDFFLQEFAREKYDCVVLDPGREGAGNAVNYICTNKIRHLVYVSCNPITVTRDMAILNKAGYVIKSWSLFNMFPNTEHIEAVFDIYLS